MSAGCRFLLTFGLAMLLISPARGQPGQRITARSRGYDALLQDQNVQKELKITDEQLSKTNKVIHEIRIRHEKELAEARTQKSVQPPAISRKISEEVLKELSSTLRSEQIKRLKQIHVQQQGLLAFADPEVERTLKLSDDQKSKLRALGVDFARQARPLFRRGAQGSFETRLKKMTDLNKQAMEKSVGILDADQKKTWKELIGEPFEIRGQSLRKAGEKER
jgi:hypothetical protein